MIEKNSIIEIEDGLKFIVLDVKEIENNKVLLLQGLDDGVHRFAIDETESENSSLQFIDDKEFMLQIAKEFDYQDRK